VTDTTETNERTNVRPSPRWSLTLRDCNPIAIFFYLRFEIQEFIIQGFMHMSTEFAIRPKLLMQEQ